MSHPKSKSPRVAAAILLVRGEGDSLEVFLGDRAPQLRFFGGYHAFIGGVRDAVDGPDDADGSDATALRKCAIRELFEETGVLVDPDIAAAIESPDARQQLRAKLLDRDALDAGAAAWADVARAESGRAPLREACRITTPPFAPVRYDTAFFVAELPPGDEPTIVSGELVGGAWWRPAEALATWRRGEIAIVPPALILLELLEQHAAADRTAFCAAADAQAQRYRAGELHEVRFSPGVVMAPLTTATIPPATTTNCLLVGTEEIWLVDPASPDPAELERLFELCDRYVAGGARIAGVLSTHHHPDHVGGLAPTCARYGVTTRAHPITLERLPADVPHGEPLEDGDTIPLGTAPDGSADWTLEALFTPGHDRGHLCFRESRYGAVIAGDMISTVSTIMIDPPEGHLQTYLDSLEKLATRAPTTIYPAHGPAAKDGPRVLAKFLRHRAQREASLVEALAQGATTPDELVRIVYADTDERMWPFAMRSLEAGLEKLREEGRA